MVLGRLGLGGVPVICTTPVSKFGKMILYDFCLNKGMEGSLVSSTPESQQQFELDDIDLALSNVTTVKYSQTIHLPGIAETAGKGKCSHQSVLSVLYLLHIELMIHFSHNMKYIAFKLMSMYLFA